MQPSIQAASARDGNSIYSPLKKYSTQLVECLITIGIYNCGPLCPSTVTKHGGLLLQYSAYSRLACEYSSVWM